MHSIGVDIGGTFTDLVGIRDGEVYIEKSSTTIDDPTRGVADCIGSPADNLLDIEQFRHGTTIAINTVLERKGARAALITTKGFRDVYAIGRSNRPEGFNLRFSRPKPLIPREWTFEISERINADGEVLTPVDEHELHRVAAELAKLEIEAVAVCFLHSYANPAHEQAAGRVIQSACNSRFVTLSSDILREYREYERTSTTALNAYVGPPVSRYLDRLDRFLDDASFSGNKQIMRSNGGTMSLEQARRQPVAMMESGPVAGMIGAGHLATLLGHHRCIGFDMGGTTAKASMLLGGAATIHEDYFIGGYSSGQPMQLPVVDIVEVGAGGGSIAWCDPQGGLHIGPQSAGANPGPACYGKGGIDPVITDADLLLGRLNPDRFLSGRMPLDPELSRTAVKNYVADPLDLDVLEAALAVTRVGDTLMALAVRSVSVARGSDPRDCAMIAFGGAGPLHAAAIARDISIPTVIIPRIPGNFSAFGMLMAPWRQDLVRTFVADLHNVDGTAIDKIMSDLSSKGRELLRQDGLDPGMAHFMFASDMRYVGQEHAISVPFHSSRDLLDGGSGSLREGFSQRHLERYGHAAPSGRIQLVKIRLTVTLEGAAEVAKDWLARPFHPGDALPREKRMVYLDADQSPVQASVHWRPGLHPGTEIIGPAVIEEPNSTTFLWPGDTALVSEYGHLIIAIERETA